MRLNPRLRESVGWNKLLFFLPIVPFIAVNGCALIGYAVTRNKWMRPKLKRLQERQPRREDLLQAAKSLILSKPRTQEEKKAQEALQLSSIGLGLSVAGLFFFPLRLVAVSFVFPVAWSAYKASYHHLVHERRFSGDVLTSVLLTGALAGGYFFTLNVGAWFVGFVSWLALKTESHSKQGIIDLFGQQERSAFLMVNGLEVEVPVERIHVGDVICVQAGQMMPLDGSIVEGNASIDQQALTGEAQPAEKGPGDPVFAATVVLSGRITVRVEKAGTATTAAEVARILTDTKDFKASLVSSATAFNDKMALPFVALGAVSLPFVGLSSALSVLQATPGYRMVLFGPLSMLSYLHLAAEVGILIKDGRSLELLKDVDTVVFDKTGTLTVEQPHVRDIHACAGFSRESVLSYAAMAEAKQSHPIARAILEEAAAQGIATNPSDEVEYEVGYGISAKLDGVTVRVGSLRFLRLQEIVIPDEILDLEEEVHIAGESLVLVSVDQAVAGALVLQPTVRPEARAIISQLRVRGLRMYIISGDHEEPTRRMARRLQVDGYFAEVLPGDKADLVQRLQAQGRKVCFVGDGINDAIALKTANVSISLHGAATIATDTAQIIFMNGDLVQLPRLFELANEFEDNMNVNFLAATLPCVGIICGALFFGLGLLPSMILYQVSVPFAVYNTMRPLLAARREASPAGVGGAVEPNTGFRKLPAY